MTQSKAPQYLQLNRGGALARMSVLRMAANEHNRNRPPSLAIDWRGARRYGFGTWAAAYCDLSQGANAGAAIWYSHTGEHFRNEEFCDQYDDSPVKHRGWYSDADGTETMRGIVGLLSHGRFVAGYHSSGNDERVYFGAVYSDIDDAMRAADAHAEQYAEVWRDDSIKSAEAYRLQDDIETHMDRLRECLALRNNDCFAKLRSEARDLIETIKAKRDDLKTNYSEFAA